MLSFLWPSPSVLVGRKWLRGIINLCIASFSIQQQQQQQKTSRNQKKETRQEYKAHPMYYKKWIFFRIYINRNVIHPYRVFSVSAVPWRSGRCTSSACAWEIRAAGRWPQPLHAPQTRALCRWSSAVLWACTAASCGLSAPSGQRRLHLGSVTSHPSRLLGSAVTVPITINGKVIRLTPWLCPSQLTEK